MITVEQYFMGRDKAFYWDLTDDVKKNAPETVRRVNLLLERAAADGVHPGIDKVTNTEVASGWRPPGVNARTMNAASHSSHLTAQGCDIQDTPDRALARWCLQNIPVLEEIGLWMERPQWTGGADPWCHVQTREVQGKRVYIPSAAVPCAPMLPGEEVFA